MLLPRISKSSTLLSSTRRSSEISHSGRPHYAQRPMGKVSYGDRRPTFNRPQAPFRERSVRPRFESEKRRTIIAGRVQKPLVKKVVKKTVETTVKKPAVKKTAAPPAPPSKTETTPSDPEKIYELSPILQSAVEAELQNIMTKVNQELSSQEATNQIEEFVLNKFKNETGEYLKNTIGLNVTTRLLDVHNDLYIDLQFPRKPANEHLKSFVKTYNPLTVKKMKDLTTFRAQIRKIKDFDRLCKEKVVKCGNMYPTIKDRYKFLVAPPGLKSVYKDNLLKLELEMSEENSKENQDKEASNKTNDDVEDKDATVEKHNETDVSIKQEKVEETEKPVTVKTEDQASAKKETEAKQATNETAQNQPTPKKETIAKQAPNKTAQKQTTPQKVQSANTAQKAQVAVKQEVSVKKEEKPNAKTDNKTVEKVTTPAKKPDQATKTQETKTEVSDVAKKVNQTAAASAKATQKQVPNKTIEKQVEKVTTPVKKPDQATKTQETKTEFSDVAKKVNQTAAASAKATQKQVPNKTIEKQNDKGDNEPKQNESNNVTANAKKVETPKVDKPQTRQTTNNQKKPATPKPALKPANKVPIKATKVPPPPTPIKSRLVFEDDLDDNEELTDQDILALMKEAIVLDECSGSDVE